MDGSQLTYITDLINNTLLNRAKLASRFNYDSTSVGNRK